MSAKTKKVSDGHYLMVDRDGDEWTILRTEYSDPGYEWNATTPALGKGDIWRGTKRAVVSTIEATGAKA